MYFTSVTRFSPEHGRTLPYYKIKESFRDVLGRVHTRVMLTPGYLPDLCCDEIVQIRRGLTYLMEQSAFIPEQPTLFPIDPRTEYSERSVPTLTSFGKKSSRAARLMPHATVTTRPRERPAALLTSTPSNIPMLGMWGQKTSACRPSANYR